MKKLVLAAIAVMALGSAAYADTIKVGVIGPFSGPFALQGKNFKAGIDAYMALNGNKVGDHEVEATHGCGDHRRGAQDALVRAPEGHVRQPAMDGQRGGQLGGTDLAHRPVEVVPA
jgi:hypothetical protein